MRFRLQRLRLTFRRSPALALAPLAVLYGLLPLTVFLSPPAQARENWISAARMFLPLCFLLWAMGYLHPWLESEGQEAMRACSRGKTFCAPELGILWGLLVLLLLPCVAVSSGAADSLWGEVPYLAAQGLWMSGGVYLASLLLHSASMGSMLLLCYHLFCVFFSRSDATMGLCLLKLSEQPAAANCLLPALLGAGLLLLGGFYERFLLRRYS